MAFIHKIILLLILVAIVKSEYCIDNNQECMFFPKEKDVMCNKSNKLDIESCIQMDFIESQENSFSLDNSPWLTIETFRYANIRTIFNITIFHGGWSHLKMRYEGIVNGKVTDEDFHCRDITVSPKIEETFSYTCAWSAWGNKPGRLEIQTDNGDDNKFGKYMFVIPKNERIDPEVNIANLTIFIYIEITDTKNPIAHIQLANSKLKITSYNVTTYKVVNGSNYRVSDRNFSPSDARSNVLRFLVNEDVDDFIIGVIPTDSSGNTGRESWSPIVKKGKPHLGAVKISLITLAVLLPVLILCILLWRHFRKQELARLNRIENDKLTEHTKLSYTIVKKSIDPELSKFNLGYKDKEEVPEVKRSLINTKGLVLN